MKKVLFIIIAAAIGIGIVMLVQSNKMTANGQNSAIAPITEDTMTPATEAPAAPETAAPESAPATTPDTSAAPAEAPADNAAVPPCPSTPDNSTPGMMMQDGKQVPCMPSSDSMQGTMNHSMNDTQTTPDTTQSSGTSTGSTSGNGTSGNGSQNMGSTIQGQEDAAMNGATGNPGAPINNVNESTK